MPRPAGSRAGGGRVLSRKNLHAIYLFNRSDDHVAWVDRQLRGANVVFARAGIGFAIQDSRIAPFRGGVCRVGACGTSRSGTPDQRTLFKELAAGIPASDIVVFIAKAILPNSDDGCAWHPARRPGCVVAASEDSSDPQYILAHELGHVLGLPHDELHSDRLMFPSIGWSRLPPKLGPEDLAWLAGQGPKPVRAAAPRSAAEQAQVPLALRFELEKLSPDLAGICRPGLSVAAELMTIYRTSPRARVKARALSALLHLRADGMDDLVASAAQSAELPIRLATAHRASSAADPRWNLVLDALRDDADPAVRQLASA